MNDCLYSVIHTKKKGRCAEANKFISYGTTLLIDLPLACVPVNAEGHIDILEKYSYSALEQSFVREARKRGYQDFKAVILAARVLRKLHGERISNRSQELSGQAKRSQTLGLSNKALYDSLNASISSSTSSPEYLSSLAASAMMVQRLVFPLTLSLEECRTTLLKLSNNAFSITDSSLEIIGHGLYLHASVFNHSCQPNAIHTFQQETMVITALRDIQPGEEILVSYIDLAMPRELRQSALLPYGFICDCARCWGGVEDLECIRCPYCKSYAMQSTKSHELNLYQQWQEMKTPFKSSKAPSSEIKRFKLLGLPHVHDAVDLHCKPCGKTLRHAALMKTYTEMVQAYDASEMLLSNCHQQQYAKCDSIADALETMKTSADLLMSGTCAWCKVMEVVLELHSQLIQHGSSLPRGEYLRMVDGYMEDYAKYVQSKFTCYRLSPSVHPAALHSYLLYLELALLFCAEHQYNIPQQRLWRHQKELKGMLAYVKRFFGSDHEYFRRLARIKMELSRR
eukprot:gene31193-37700_t